MSTLSLFYSSCAAGIRFPDRMSLQLPERAADVKADDGERATTCVRHARNARYQPSMNAHASRLTWMIPASPPGSQELHYPTSAAEFDVEVHGTGQKKKMITMIAE